MPYPLNLLVTFNQHYIPPFRTMLNSLLCNDPEAQVTVWLLHSQIPQAELDGLEAYCTSAGADLKPVQVDKSLFKEAPVMKQYPQEMYYRLLAAQLLPESVEKVLYLDSDILVLNPVRSLWELDLQGKAFAAASHSGVINVMNQVNRIRLNVDHDYYNSGVMLMDLKAAREIVVPEDIFYAVREHAAELILPDQDVFNFLYGRQTMQLPDEIWNYDVRYYSAYLLRSERRCDLDWVMENTVFLHFCGKRKPWLKTYSGRFGALYKHYRQLANRKMRMASC